MKDDIQSLAHSKWRCKYHIVFAPKFRRKVFYGEKRLEIGAILRKLCGWKGINILEGLRGPCAYVAGDSTEVFRIRGGRLFEGEK
jgi:hypothetical protein